MYKYINYEYVNLITIMTSIHSACITKCIWFSEWFLVEEQASANLSASKFFFSNYLFKWGSILYFNGELRFISLKKVDL